MLRNIAFPDTPQGQIDDASVNGLLIRVIASQPVAPMRVPTSATALAQRWHAPRSNSCRCTGQMDCFVANAPRNDDEAVLFHGRPAAGLTVRSRSVRQSWSFLNGAKEWPEGPYPEFSRFRGSHQPCALKLALPGGLTLRPLVLLPVLLIGVMAAVETAGGSTQQAVMAGVMARDATDHGAFEAALGLGGRREEQCDGGNGQGEDQGFHDEDSGLKAHERIVAA